MKQNKLTNWISQSEAFLVQPNLSTRSKPAKPLPTPSHATLLDKQEPPSKPKLGRLLNRAKTMIKRKFSRKVAHGNKQSRNSIYSNQSASQIDSSDIVNNSKDGGSQCNAKAWTAEDLYSTMDSFPSSGQHPKALDEHRFNVNVQHQDTVINLNHQTQRSSSVNSLEQYPRRQGVYIASTESNLSEFSDKPESSALNAAKLDVNVSKDPFQEWDDNRDSQISLEELLASDDDDDDCVQSPRTQNQKPSAANNDSPQKLYKLCAATRHLYESTDSLPELMKLPSTPQDELDRIMNLCIEESKAWAD